MVLDLTESLQIPIYWHVSLHFSIVISYWQNGSTVPLLLLPKESHIPRICKRLWTNFLSLIPTPRIYWQLCEEMHCWKFPHLEFRLVCDRSKLQIIAEQFYAVYIHSQCFIPVEWFQIFAPKDGALAPSSDVITKLKHELLYGLAIWCINKANKVFVVKVEERVWLGYARIHLLIATCVQTKTHRAKILFSFYPLIIFSVQNQIPSLN